MRIVKDRTKQMKRYHEDYGFLRRVKLFTKVRLNIISNKIYLLKEFVGRLITKSNKPKVEHIKKNPKVYKHVLKWTYMLGNMIYKRKIKKKKVDKKKRKEEFMVTFLRNKLFRTIYKNIKIRHFKSLYKQQKGNVNKMQQALETRIDVILVKSGLAIDIDQARHFLNMQVVEIDRRVVTQYSRSVKVGELITLKPSKLRSATIAYKLTQYKKEQILKKAIKLKKQVDKSFMFIRGAYYHLFYRKRLKLKTYRPKVPNYLETNFALYATTLLYIPESSEINYPVILSGDEIKTFLSGIPLFRRIGK